MLELIFKTAIWVRAYDKGDLRIVVAEDVQKRRVLIEPRGQVCGVEAMPDSRIAPTREMLILVSRRGYAQLHSRGRHATYGRAAYAALTEILAVSSIRRELSSATASTADAVEVVGEPGLSAGLDAAHRIQTTAAPTSREYVPRHAAPAR